MSFISSNPVPSSPERADFPTNSDVCSSGEILPQEILSAIFNKTDNAQEASLVCRHWRDVCRANPELGEKIQQEGTLGHLEQLVKLAQRVSTCSAVGTTFLGLACVGIASLAITQPFSSDAPFMECLLHPVSLLTLSLLGGRIGAAYVESRAWEVIARKFSNVDQAVILLEATGGEMAAKAKALVNTLVRLSVLE